MPETPSAAQAKDLATPVRFTVNGRDVEVMVQPLETLLETLRGPLGLKGTKGACHEGECGSCTVLVDGVPMNSCLILTPQITGQSVTTIEGIANQGELDRVQQAFVDHGAVQCGYCTPGLVVATKAFLKTCENPDRDAVCKGLEGNICRCTGYSKVIDAVMGAAEGWTQRAVAKETT